MSEQTKEHVDDIMKLIANTWTGIAISAGLISGIYNELSTEKAVSIDEIAANHDYDENKLHRWFYLMENCGIVKKENNKYFLTPKGNILSKDSPSKDAVGMFHLNKFYMEATLNSLQTFKKGRSLDKLGDGKIAVYYQPRVSDRFSETLVGHLKKYNVQKNDSLLDVGCGRGNFLKSVASLIPDVKLTGIDTNLYAIENGKMEFDNLVSSGKMNLIAGDITDELNKYPDNSFDWVTSINVFHFVPEEKRMPLIQNMLRIAKKGIFMTLVVVEKTLAARTADPLMFLLWNDYTGFFKSSEYEDVITALKIKYPKYTFNSEPIMEGNSNLVMVLKQ